MVRPPRPPLTEEFLRLAFASERALCCGPGIDPNWWFSDDYVLRVRATRLCERCPLQQPCREAAIAQSQHGIWGGTSREQRRQARIARKAS